jgi:hypothetical protein
MKTFFVISLLLTFVLLSTAVPAFADPRMETNKNFCHFILDSQNTDNEVFVAGCDSAITVVENLEIAGTVQTECEENYVASGYSRIRRIIPAKAAPALPNTTLIFTSDNTDYPCTMVESNGRAYKSYKWQSTVKVGNIRQNGSVRVLYELFCKEGHRK